MKKLIKSLVCFVLLLALATSGLMGCKPNEAPAATLVDFSDKTVELNYGSAYRLITTVFDTNGNEYEVSYQVKTTAGDKVFVNGNKFTTLDAGGYVVTYTTEFDGKTVNCKHTIKVNAGAPVITFGLGLEVVYNGWPANMPQITAYDYFDGDVSNSITVEIYRKTSTGEQKLNYTGNGKFTFASAGEYILRAHAVNSKGQMGTLDKVITVTDQSELTDYIWKVEESTGSYLGSSFKYIDAANLDGVIEGEYKGNAVRRATYGSLKDSLLLKLGNRDLSGYTHVSIWVAVDKFTIDNMTNLKGYINLGRSNALLSRALEKPMYYFTEANSGKWVNALVPVEDFIEMVAGQNQVQMIDSSLSGVNGNNRPYIYIGDVMLVADMNDKDVVGNDKDWGKI